MILGIDKGEKESKSITSYVRITPNGICLSNEPFIKNSIPKRYIFNGNTTILIHDDDSKTIVKTMEGDKFDPVMGFLTAYFQKHSGLSKSKANDYLVEVRKKYEETIGLVKVKTKSEPRSKYKFKVGDRVKIVANKRGHRFEIGEIVRIKEVLVDVEYDYIAEHLDRHDYWYVTHEELQLINEREEN